MTIEIISNLVVRNEKGEILLVKEEKDWYYKIPGGTVEERETLESAAIRETLEETGVQTEVSGYLNTYELRFKSRDFRFHVHKGNIIEGEPKVNEAHLEFCGWFTLDFLDKEGAGPNKLIYQDLMRENDS